MDKCHYCGLLHPDQMCPLIKAIEYHPDGSISRIEFKDTKIGPVADIIPFPEPKS